MMMIHYKFSFLIKKYERDWRVIVETKKEAREKKCADDDIQKIGSAMKSETLFFLENLMMKKMRTKKVKIFYFCNV
jgi:hypothetical protein